MRRIPRVGSLALVGMFIVVAAGTAQAGSIYYRLAIDDIVAGNHVKTPGGTIKVTIEANVPDMPLGGGLYGGVVQYAANLLDSTGTGAGSALAPKDADTNGLWDSLSYSPLNLNVAGTIDASGYDVYAQTGSILPQSNTSLGAGPGVWSAVGSGDFLYNGGTVMLTVQPYALSGQRIWGTGGAEAPTAAYSYSTTITPEPATMVLLGLGGLGLILRRKRR